MSAPAKLRGQHLISFSAAKAHIARYPWTAEMEAVKAELSRCKAGKATIQFPKGQPLSLPPIRQIAAFRRIQAIGDRNFVREDQS